MARKQKRQKQKQGPLRFIMWFTGVVVSLAVGFGLIEKALTLPTWLGGLHPVGLLISQLAGWIVVATTLISVLLVIISISK
jgi:hypothetical protein